MWYISDIESGHFCIITEAADKILNLEVYLINWFFSIKFTILIYSFLLIKFLKEGQGFQRKVWILLLY